MTEPFWRKLTTQDDLEAQYEILLGMGYSADVIAIHLARFAEARIFNAADARITELEVERAKLKRLTKEHQKLRDRLAEWLWEYRRLSRCSQADNDEIVRLHQERDELRATLAAVEAERVRLQVALWGTLFEDDESVHPVQRTVSGLAMAMLERTLAEGKSIHIPSLGIVIEPPQGKPHMDDMSSPELDGQAFLNDESALKWTGAHE